jgi:hypothetical protein
VVARQGGIYTLLGLGNGLLGAPQAYVGSMIQSFDIGDLDNDGRPDVVAVTLDANGFIYWSQGCSPR